MTNLTTPGHYDEDVWNDDGTYNDDDDDGSYEDGDVMMMILLVFTSPYIPTTPTT